VKKEKGGWKDPDLKLKIGLFKIIQPHYKKEVDQCKPIVSNAVLKRK